MFETQESEYASSPNILKGSSRERVRQSCPVTSFFFTQEENRAPTLFGPGVY